jgi:hypothetical protein
MPLAHFFYYFFSALSALHAEHHCFNSITYHIILCIGLSDSTVVIDFKGCDHDTQYEGMCVVCCKTVLMNQDSHVLMAHDATSLAVSRTVSNIVVFRLKNLIFQSVFYDSNISSLFVVVVAVVCF